MIPEKAGYDALYTLSQTNLLPNLVSYFVKEVKMFTD